MWYAIDQMDGEISDVRFPGDLFEGTTLQQSNGEMDLHSLDKGKKK